MLDKPLAILTRDAKLALSYPVWFALQWLGIAASATSLFFVSKIVPPSGSFSFNGTPTSYFAFALVNVAFLTFQTAALQSFDNAVRDDQVRGTLEATFVTPTSVRTIVLSSGLWAFGLALLNVVCYLLIGALFGLRFAHFNIAAGVVLVLLTITATVPIGILSAAGVMVLKQGAPVQFLFNLGASLLAGVLFPITVLPVWLQYCSWLLPTTHALHGIRGAVQGATFGQLSPDMLWLGALSIVLFPFALWVFRCAVARAKQDGTLAHY
ncbi:MAG TPA: ABC transporter permease [Candidatus Lustribacter sp.]